METILLILMGVAMFLYPVWLMLGHFFDETNCSIYPRKSDWIIGTLGILTLVCLILAVIFIWID